MAQVDGVRTAGKPIGHAGRSHEVQVGDNHQGTLRRKDLRTRLADAAGTPGYDGNPPREALAALSRRISWRRGHGAPFDAALAGASTKPAYPLSAISWHSLR